MPEKAKKTGGGNYFQSAPKVGQQSPDQAVNNEISDIKPDEDVKASDTGSFDVDFDLQAAEAALNGITDKNSTDPDSDSTIDTKDRISIDLPPELNDVVNIDESENDVAESSDAGNSEAGAFSFELPDTTSDDGDPGFTDTTSDKGKISAAELIAKLRDLAETGDFDTENASEAAAEPETETEAKPETEEASESALVAEATTTESTEKSTESSQEDNKSDESSDKDAAAAAAAAVTEAVKKKPDKVKKPVKPKKEKPAEEKKSTASPAAAGIIIGIAAASVVLGGAAFAGTNYIYQHLTSGINEHIYASGGNEPTSAENTAFESIGGKVSFVRSVKGSKSETVTVDKMTVGEYIRSIEYELKSDSSGQDVEYASNYPNYTVLDQGMELTIDVVSYKTVETEESIPYSTEIIGSDSIPIGERMILRSGIDGYAKRTYNQKYVNGQMISNEIVKQEMISEPQSEVYFEGIGGIFVAPDGTEYEYLYYLDCEATAYGYNTGFGGDGLYAYSGKLIEIGDIATDPEVIPLGSTCYIICDEYDIGVTHAEDIGSAIKGNKVDIYMGREWEDYLREKEFGRRQVRVYVLALPEE